MQCAPGYTAWASMSPSPLRATQGGISSTTYSATVCFCVTWFRRSSQHEIGCVSFAGPKLCSKREKILFALWIGCSICSRRNYRNATCRILMVRATLLANAFGVPLCLRFTHAHLCIFVCTVITGLLRGNYCTLWGLLWQLKQAYPPAPGPVTRHVSLHTSVYSAAESDALEESLAIWLHSLGLLEVGAGQKPRSLHHVMDELADGTLLCRLAEYICRRRIPGTTQRPRARGAALSNVRKACAAFGSLKHMGRRFLAIEEKMVDGDRVSLMGLLEDAHRACNGEPPRPMVRVAVEKPYFGDCPPRSSGPQREVDDVCLAPVFGMSALHSVPAATPGDVGASLMGGGAGAAASPQRSHDGKPFMYRSPARSPARQQSPTRLGLRRSSWGAVPTSPFGALAADIVPTQLGMGQPNEPRAGSGGAVPAAGSPAASLAAGNTASAAGGAGARPGSLSQPPPLPPPTFPVSQAQHALLLPTRSGVNDGSDTDSDEDLPKHAVLVDWLRSLGIVLEDPFCLEGKLANEFTDGLILCAAIEKLRLGRAVPGVCPQPKMRASCLNNIRKAFDALKEKKVRAA